MTWQWWVSQGCALVCLTLVVICFQQKTKKNLVFLHIFANLFYLAGLIFLQDVSGIILGAVALTRDLVSLYLAYRPKKIVKITASLLLVAAVITLNIVFWTSYLAIFSIVSSCLNIYGFMQENPKIIRFCSGTVNILLIIYFSILFSPINIAIEAIGFMSVLIAVIRFDIKKKEEKHEQM